MSELQEGKEVSSKPRPCLECGHDYEQHHRETTEGRVEVLECQQGPCFCLFFRDVP
jgi:hypothetical protein